MRMDAKRTLILGGGGAGIGRELTRTFGGAGAHVAVADLDESRAGEAAEEIRRAGGTACPLQGDVTDAAEIERLLADAAAKLGGLDALVTVVGGQVAFVPAVRLHEMADEDWDTMYEVNLRYVSRAVRAALRMFLDHGTRGAIVSVGSVTGFMGAPRQGAYGVMKAGLLSLARTVAAEYSAEGIRMNVVAGGAIATAAANADADGTWVDEIPVGRYGTGRDIAEAALYLVDDASSYVTGQQIVVDGGVSVRGPF